MQIALIVLGAYLLGSVSFAIVVSRLMRLPDPRTFGSKNPGATNVLRTGRKLAAVLTLAGDAGKGWLAVWLADRYLGYPGATGIEVPLAGVAVFLGHLFPVYYRFHGGKGVATAAGVLVGFNPWLGLATVVTWAVIAVFFRLSSLAALVSAVFAPVYAWWLFGLRPVLPAVIALSVLLVWRHKQNIARLLAGEEGRIGEKQKQQQG